MIARTGDFQVLGTKGGVRFGWSDSGEGAVGRYLSGDSPGPLAIETLVGGTFCTQDSSTMMTRGNELRYAVCGVVVVKSAGDGVAPVRGGRPDVAWLLKELEFPDCRAVCGLEDFKTDMLRGDRVEAL